MSAAKGLDQASFVLPPKVRDRTLASVEAAESFVRAGTPLRRRAPGRRLSLHVEYDVARRLLVRCAEEDRSISDAVTEAVEAWLAKV